MDAKQEMDNLINSLPDEVITTAFIEIAQNAGESYIRRMERLKALKDISEKKEHKKEEEPDVGKREHFTCSFCGVQDTIVTQSLGKDYCFDCIRQGRDNNPNYPNCPNYKDFTSPNYLEYMKGAKRE